MAQYTMDTDGVAGLEDQYGRQAESVGTARSTVAGIIAQVDGLLAQAIATEQPLNAALDVLVGDANTTLSMADGVNWTGPSADRFRASTAEMNNAIVRIRTALSEAYGDFRLAAGNLNERLADVGREFDATCADCEAATLDNKVALTGHRGDTSSLFEAGLS